MTMRIAPTPHFWAEVKFFMLGDLDTSIEVSFKAKYKRLEQEEYEKLLTRVQAARLAALTNLPGYQAAASVAVGKEGTPADATPGDAKPITDLQMIEEVLLDWDDVVGDDDEKLPFTKDNLARTLKALGCKAAICKRFFDLHNKEQEKNFARPPATTSAT